MFFEKDKYYKYIGNLEKIVNFYYVIFIVIFAISGVMLLKGLGMILGILIGFLIASGYTLKTKILIQDMKWKLDMHELIKK